MKEELDKIEAHLELAMDLFIEGFGPEVVAEIGAAHAELKELRPRLEKALKLLEQHELLNSMDSGDQ